MAKKIGVNISSSNGLLPADIPWTDVERWIINQLLLVYMRQTITNLRSQKHISGANNLIRPDILTLTMLYIFFHTNFANIMDVDAWALFQYINYLSRYGDIQWKFPLLVKRRLYIERGPWLLLWPAPQQTLHQLPKTCRFLSFMRKNFSYMCHLSTQMHAKFIPHTSSTPFST